MVCFHTTICCFLKFDAPASPLLLWFLKVVFRISDFPLLVDLEGRKMKLQGRKIKLLRCDFLLLVDL